MIQGPEVEAFEREFAAYVGAPHAIAVSNGTAALHLALLAVGIGEGDEVITVSHSFVATANVVRLVGATPVFVDVEAASGNIDVDRIEPVVTSRTRAILAVHQIGHSADLDRLVALADRLGVVLIEDAACAIGSETRSGNQWERIGKPHGRLACFSFHPRKLLTTGEGGMVTTRDEALAKRIRLLRQHGIDGGDCEVVGFNYRMTDIQAAVGRVQLARVPEMVRIRRNLAERYRRNLRSLEGLDILDEPSCARSNWQSFCVRLPYGADQSAVLAGLAADGISAKGGVSNAHRSRAYKDEPWSCGSGPGRCGCPVGSCARLAASEAIEDRCILLPLYHGMTEAEQDHVIASLARVTGTPS